MPPTLMPLGQTRWALWRETAVRGAGFPAALFAEICDDELAEAADGFDDRAPDTREQYRKVFARATERLTAATRRIASDRGFREAITWQNPPVVRNCLDKVVDGERRDHRGRRHELTIARYLQRYCLKNESIGFFGPVGWGRFVSEDIGLSQAPGAALLAHRTTHFECWPIDALAETVANLPGVWPWLRAITVPAARLDRTILRVPSHKPLTMSPIDLRVLRQCDGRHAVRDITGDPPDPAALAALLRLRDCGAVQIDLRAPFTGFPERVLIERLGHIGDEAVRARAMAPVGEMLAAREAVSAAAGDPERLMAATSALDETFERITGTAATRRAGEQYAGRTLLYEEARRSGEVRIGQRVVDRLAEPLGLVLDSAAWLVDEIGQRYEQRAKVAYQRELTRTGAADMPLMQLVAVVMPEFMSSATWIELPETVTGAQAEYQRRWLRIVGLTREALESTRRHQVSCDAIADAVAREFPARPPRWTTARWHAPDLMLTSTDPASFVMGELHLATNTLEAQLFATMHSEPARLREAAQASGLDDRITVIRPQQSAVIATSRFARSFELMLPSYTYLTIGTGSHSPPPGAKLLFGGEMVVRLRDGELVAHHPADGGEYPFMQLIGDTLSLLSCNAFRPFAAERHLPRVTIGPLVINRESWNLPATRTPWAFVKDEELRYVQARRWRRKLRLPERVFCRIPAERKPMAVDFRSLPLVNLLAGLIRKAAEAGPDGTFSLSEMLPDLEHLWLRDAEGNRYTSELRMVVVDQLRFSNRPSA